MQKGMFFREGHAEGHVEGHVFDQTWNHAHNGGQSFTCRGSLRHGRLLRHLVCRGLGRGRALLWGEGAATAASATPPLLLL